MSVAKKLKPARRQVQPGEIVAPVVEQGGKEFNIWYGKWSGGDTADRFQAQTKSQTRCILARDAGYTRADALGVKYSCMFFAKGCCPMGVQCNYLHRIPPATAILPNAATDIFGREKHADYKDDMGGTGSFARQNRTLYIGKVREEATRDETNAVVRRHFGEWGDIERVNILATRGVAFVTYRHEHAAQFAKEAMMNQSLDQDEILNVRWATEDPNPSAISREKRRIERVGDEALRNKVARVGGGKVLEAAGVVQALENGDEDALYAIPDSAAVEAAAAAAEQQAAAGGGGGILGQEALDGMRYLLERRREADAHAASNGGGAEPTSTTATATTTAAAEKAASAGGLGALGGYGSESEEDD